MTTALQQRQTGAQSLEQVLIQGDLSKLTPEDRVIYYKNVCDSVGLNPLTRPLDYLTLNGKLTLYAKKDATDQLRKLHAVSITSLERETIEGVYLVTAHASIPGGREDTSTGAVSIKGLSGDSLANAFMKAETKAKRRVTLSICGLGILDETELETIPNAQPYANTQNYAPAPERIAPAKPTPAPTVKADVLTGEIIEPKQNGRVMIPGLGDGLAEKYEDVFGDDAPLPDEDPAFFGPPPTEAAPAPRVLTGGATEKQIAAIRNICKGRHIDPEAFTQERFGCTPDELSKQQASTLMDEFNKNRR